MVTPTTTTPDIVTTDVTTDGTGRGVTHRAWAGRHSSRRTDQFKVDLKADLLGDERARRDDPHAPPGAGSGGVRTWFGCYTLLS
jgi:hypothetical protein